MKYAGKFDLSGRGGIRFTYHPLTEEGTMIVVEGPDGAGKSTLVEKLRGSLQLPVSPKVVSSDTTALVDLGQWVETNTAKGFQRMIFDRHRLISEPIYGPATRRSQDANFVDLGWLSQQMWLFYQAKPIVVYCLPGLDVIRENVARAETDNAAVANRISAIYAGYVARASVDLTRAVGRLYNYKTSRYEDVLGWVQWQLNERLTQNAGELFIPRQSEASRAAQQRPHHTLGG